MKQTHCLRGHLRSPDNLTSVGQCKICHTIQGRQRHFAKRDQILAAARKRYWDNPQKHREASRQWAKDNPNKATAIHRTWRWSNRSLCLLSATRRRARNTNTPFNLTLEDIFIPDVCPILGIPLFFTPRKVTNNTPSLDKIIPNLGYVKGNVAVISMKANGLKNNASLKEFKSLIQYLETHGVQ